MSIANNVIILPSVAFIMKVQTLSSTPSKHTFIDFSYKFWLYIVLNAENKNKSIFEYLFTTLYLYLLIKASVFIRVFLKSR